MTKIKILDCTLRDGGYINNWEFREKNIQKIIENLSSAKIEYIECGFLKNLEYNNDKSFFNTIEQLEKFIVQNSYTKYTLMINHGEIPIEQIQSNTNKNIMLRIAFKKSQKDEAINYCQQLKQKGYEIFINPMHTNTYSSIELLNLVDEVNKISPKAFTIVDTTGSMKEKDILSMYYLVDNSLNKDIALCFHSHNNLQLSFSNAQVLMNVAKNRELIIDSTVFGMGRGAGNLCSELLVQYINDNYNGSYNIIPILKIVDEQINPIFAKTPWGYSVPYYLAAINHCHPNYAKYLIDKQSVPVEIINRLLEAIPDNKKSGYDADLIKQIYLDNFSNVVDDTNTVKYIENKIKNRKILLLAPGKSIINEKEKIDTFIKNNNPFIISLNFISHNFKQDIAFVVNLKRFSTLENTDIPLVIASNIENIPKGALVINYSSYLNNSLMFDNAALMMIKLLINIGTKEIALAGLDGFSSSANENYFDDSLINNAKVCEIDKRNEIMTQALKEFNNEIKINFITKTKYNIQENL